MVCILHSGAAVDQTHSGRIEQAPVDVIQPLDLAYLVVAQRGPLEPRGFGQMPAKTGAILEGLMEVGGIRSKASWVRSPH